MNKIENTIIFDNTCNLCNNTVNWINSNSKDDHVTFKFLPFKSTEAQLFLKDNGFRTDQLESVITLENTNYYIQSDAFLQITQHLNNWKTATNVIKLIPPFIRNTIYVIAAKNRIKWFGSKEDTQCSIY